MSADDAVGLYSRLHEAVPEDLKKRISLNKTFLKIMQLNALNAIYGLHLYLILMHKNLQNVFLVCKLNRSKSFVWYIINYNQTIFPFIKYFFKSALTGEVHISYLIE